MLYMRECSRPEREDGRAHLRVGDDLDAEDVGEPVAPAVIPELPEDEVLTFLVEEEDPAEHYCGRRGR